MTMSTNAKHAEVLNVPAITKNITLTKKSLAAIAVLVIILFPIYGPSEGLHVAIIGLMGGVAALALNLFFGYCGQINFGTAGFMAIGGYGVALLEKYTGLPYFACLGISVFAAGLIAFVFSFPLLRLRHYVLALGTLAFGLGVYEVVSKGLSAYTGGEDGIDIEALTVGATQMGDTFFFYLFLATNILALWISYALRKSRTGRAMVAISVHETASVSMGININLYLTKVFVLSGMILALAGGLFVKWSLWCSPEFFSLMTSISILLAVVMGGIGSALGACVGGAIIFSLREMLVPLALYDILAYGLILGIILLFMPKGITGGVLILTKKIFGRKNNIHVA